jgi:hypothetical protein
VTHNGSWSFLCQRWASAGQKVLARIAGHLEHATFSDEAVLRSSNGMWSS